MAADYSRTRDRGGGSDRKETSVPSLEVIRGIIQGSDTEKLVECAEEIGRGLAQNERLTASQIRTFFSEVKRIEGSIQEERTQQKGELSDQDTRRLILLKPRLAYQARRQIESHKGYGVAKLEEVLKPAINFVEGKVENFRNFVDFFEAILAYHKAAGGRD